MSSLSVVLYPAGSFCEAQDSVPNWETAEILEERGDSRLVRYLDWGSSYDEWIAANSARLR